MKKICLILFIQLLMVFVLSQAFAEDTINYYVSKGGSDSYSGKLPTTNSDETDGPFASIDKAREVVRDLKESGKLNRSVKIVVREGKYNL